MKKFGKISAVITALAAANCTTAALSYETCAEEILEGSDNVYITLYPQKQCTEISPYIYGINDSGDLENISASVIKQTGAAISSYNWENNYSNSGIDGGFSNNTELAGIFYNDLSSPAMLADALYARSLTNRIPLRLATLQMMGFVAADSMGVVSSDQLSRNTRWRQVKFTKNDTYLTQPDTADDYVYIDEYVSFLVNRYGYAEDGGISGYFLDSEPDLWAERFSVTGIDSITPKELVERSAELSSAVKAIDSGALIFGPSVSGIGGAINLNASQGSTDDFAWFIDYYLSAMKNMEDTKGIRLLDVLDVHYRTEATTPLGTAVIDGTDDYSKAYRMQSVRTLWDADYTENSVTVLLNKQFTPFIPTLKASVRLYYPGTKLSFSEYDFGGGGDMSGAIAQIDALGTFAREEVYLACLAPSSTDFSFQKAAMRLFTDYDGSGSGLGSLLIPTDGNDDTMSSVYAGKDEDGNDTIRVIVTNQCLETNKNFEINIQSDELSYELAEAYYIDENADIAKMDLTDEELAEGFDLNDNTLTFSASPLSAYMLVLTGADEDTTEDTQDASLPADTEITSQTVYETLFSDESSFHPSDTEETTTQSEASVTTVTESSTAVSYTQTTQSAEQTSSSTEATQTAEVSPSETETTPDDEKKGVAAPVKVIVSALAVSVALGIAYILFFDRRGE